MRCDAKKQDTMEFVEEMKEDKKAEKCLENLGVAYGQRKGKSAQVIFNYAHNVQEEMCVMRTTLIRLLADSYMNESHPAHSDQFSKSYSH
ncbi:hypothetical protein ACLKA6_012523 [Drosophila palustris]